MLLRYSSGFAPFPLPQHCFGPMAPPPSAAIYPGVAAGDYQEAWEKRVLETFLQGRGGAIILNLKLSTSSLFLSPTLVIFVILGKEFIFTGFHLHHV